MDSTPGTTRLLDERAIYEAAKAHARHRGIDLTEWPNQQALVPDEVRWMTDAIVAYLGTAGTVA